MCKPGLGLPKKQIAKSSTDAFFLDGLCYTWAKHFFLESLKTFGQSVLVFNSEAKKNLYNISTYIHTYTCSMNVATTDLLLHTVFAY
jgi:hypothetical protein